MSWICILRQLMFLIYMNDIINDVPNDNIYVFADDSNLFFHGKAKTEVMERVIQCLSNRKEWFFANKLSLSLNKT